MIMTKVTDDLLMASIEKKMKPFGEDIPIRFLIIKAIINEGIKFNGSKITDELDGTICISFVGYVTGMEPMSISSEVKTNRMDLATEYEI